MMFEVLLVSEASGQHCNIAVHDSKNGQSLSTFKGGISQPATLCLRKDQQVLSAVPNKPIIQAFELSRKSQNPVKIPVPGVVTCLTTSHDGALLAAGIKNDVLVWEMVSGDLLSVLSRHYQKITALEFSHDNSYLVSGGEDGIVSVRDVTDIWDDEAQKCEPYCSWTCYTNPVSAVKFGLRYRLYTSSLDCSVKVHDIPSRQIIMTLVFDDSVTSFCLNPCETSLFVGCSKGALVCHNLLQRNPQSTVIQAASNDDNHSTQQVKNAHNKKISCISCNMDGSFIVTGSDDQEVKFWDATSLQCVKSIKVNGAVTNLLLLPAFHGFTAASKTSIMALPKLNRQLRTAHDEGVEQNLKYFHTLQSES